MNTEGNRLGRGYGHGGGYGQHEHHDHDHDHEHHHGQGHGRATGHGGGRNNGGGYGVGGFCVCAKCGNKIPHQAGVKCTTIRCTECNTPMIREELLEAKRAKKKQS